MKISVIGAGAMGGAIVEGLVKGDFVKNEDIPFTSSRKIRSGLRSRLADFDYYIDTSSIPRLSKLKIKAWLG